MASRDPKDMTGSRDPEWNIRMNVAALNMGCRRVVNPETGRAAYYPMNGAPTEVDAWQRDAKLAFHGAKEPVPVEAKPSKAVADALGPSSGFTLRRI